MWTIASVLNSPSSATLSDPMKFVPAVVLCLALAQLALGVTIDHDKVEPFAQPEPVTVSEKAAIKYKPQLYIDESCASFPAVNAAGEISGGLKGTRYTRGCSKAPKGSQVYGRSAWYQDKWAMMFAWYFPKNFWRRGSRSRHLWENMVLWIDNPALENPTILGASLSRQTLGEPKPWTYKKVTAIHPVGFVGTIVNEMHRRYAADFPYDETSRSNISTRVYPAYPDNAAWVSLDFALKDGEYQDLIMWNQLTDEARAALESADFGVDIKVPFNDKNFEAFLKEAFPF